MTPVPNLHDLATMTAAQRARLLQRTETDLSGYEDKVRQIIDAVRAEGDEALARFARDFDKAPVQANEIAATEADFDAAEKALAPDVREAMEYAAVSIRKFHEDQKPEEMWLHEIRPGAFAGDRITAIPSAALRVGMTTTFAAERSAAWRAANTMLLLFGRTTTNSVPAWAIAEAISAADGFSVCPP